MKALVRRKSLAFALVAIMLPVGTAYAQLGELLKGGGGSGPSGGLGGLGGALSGQSVTSGSTGNVAGLLEFCMKNNFLSASHASAVKDQLIGKLGGGPPASHEGYKEGAKGLLTDDGQQLDLSGGGMKADLTKQVCDKVLSQGKSLL